MPGQYNIIAINNSARSGSICVYQTDPNVNDPHVVSLAWLVEDVAPNTTAKFTLTVDYSFVWSETPELVPGVIFEASEIVPAHLADTNQISFTYLDGAFKFLNQTAGPEPGNLYIREEASVPPNATAVGIGMSGAATFAVPSQPDRTVIFWAHPRYFITFGNRYTQGEVLDVHSMLQKAEVVFPTGVASMTATFGADDRWTVTMTRPGRRR